MAKYGSEENFTKRVKGEVAQLYLLDHPGIVRFYDAIFKVTEVEIYTEWLESRNLDSYIKDHYTLVLLFRGFPDHNDR
jgi:serine/threonine protein kinase